MLALVFRDHLHQLQYVSRVQTLVLFLVKHGLLTTADFDVIWDAQDGQHETIAMNVLGMLASLALELSLDELDHLFERIRVSDITVAPSNH